MIQTKTVDITPMKITLPVIEMSQYDLGRQVIVHMKDGSDWFDLTGYTAKLQGTKPSGFGYTVDGVVGGHDITFASNYDMTSEAGFIPSEVRLTKDGVSLGSLNVILHVEKTPHDVSVTDGSPETIVPEITELVERAEAAAEVLLDCSATATALPAGSSATASYDVDNGVFHFGIPRGNKGETGDTGATGNGIASIAKTGTSGLVDTYTITYTNGTTTTFTVTNGQNGTGAVADVWQNGVSVLDGTTAKVTVPTYVPVTDNEPYLFRQSGNGLDIHNREHDTLVGGTVAWNQLLYNGDFSSGWGLGYHATDLTLQNNEATFTATGSYAQIASNNGLTPIKGHVYLSTLTAKCSATRNLALGNSQIGYSYKPVGTSFTNIGSLRKVDEDKIWSVILVVVSDSTDGDTITVKEGNIYDLTQMFGSAIADYIYSLEQANEGAGVAWFKKLFPKSYYAYNAGELKHVSGVSAHVMRDADNNVVGNYPLDSTLTLRGIPKLSNGKLYYDGDTYASDGTVTRKYGIVDLGTLTWSSAGVGDTYHATISDLKWETDGNVVVNAICQKYVAVTKNYFGSNPTVQGVYRSDSGHPILYFRDSTYTTTDAFKTAMLGVYLVYELATPTTETAEPYTNPQVVDESGTEEYVSTSIVPVGHQTAYPDLFSGDYNDLVNKPTNVSDFTNDAGYISTETDPTVPSWAKASSKPSYTATEVSCTDSSGGTSNVQAELEVSQQMWDESAVPLTDLNDVPFDGVRRVQLFTYTDQSSHIPTGVSYGGGIMFYTSANFVTQFCIANDYTRTPYIRHKTSTGWTPWSAVGGTIVLSVASFSSLPQTVSDDRITNSHVCIKAELSAPSAQTGDWTVTTSDGSLTISGSISGSTTATLYLTRKESDTLNG